MNALLSPYFRLGDALSRAAPDLLPLLARLTFAGVLLLYFWASAVTKLGDGAFGIVSPSIGAYSQIFPKVLEASGYDASQLGLYHRAVVVAGTWAEFILPLLILLGLLTRLAAMGMIGFVLVQSATDVWGHGVGGDTLGAWFDRASDAAIMDQRGLWILLFAVLVLMGAGRLSLDALLRARADAA